MRGTALRATWLVLLLPFVTLGCESCREPPPGATLTPTTATASATPTPAASESEPTLPVAGSGSTSDRPSPSTSAARRGETIPGAVTETTWRFPDTPVGEMSVVVVVPSEASENNRLPVLVAFHGQGEALKGPVRGARGWVDDYWLPKAIRKLHHPPLSPADFRHATTARVSEVSQALATTPYQGLIVVCPYTPYQILKGERAFRDAGLLADFVVDHVLPKVYRETPALGTPQTTGVDGVSLGGRASLLIGLARPEAFHEVGGLQAAFDVQDAPMLTDRAKEAVAKNGDLSFRFLTTDGDFYLESTKAIHEAFTKEGLRSELLVVPGPHAYSFNRGSGVLEMLVFHDRALRSLPSIGGSNSGDKSVHGL